MEDGEMKEYDPIKLAAMVHYIADAAPSGLLGKTKLNKILWFSDREMFLRKGETISGETYQKFPQGPVSRHLLDILDILVRERRIAVRKGKVYDYEQYEYISLVEPDISLFSNQDVDVIRRQIDRVIPLTAKEVSSLSHGTSWEIADFGQPVPMYSVLADKTREMNQDDLAWALEDA
jgi:hypothetical protein